MNINIKSYFSIILLLFLLGCEPPGIQVDEIPEIMEENVSAPIEVNGNVISDEQRIIIYYESLDYTCTEDLVCNRIISKDVEGTDITSEAFDLKNMTYTYNRTFVNSDLMTFTDVVISLETGFGGFEQRNIGLKTPFTGQYRIIRNLLTGENEFTINSNEMAPVFRESSLENIFNFYLILFNQMLNETLGMDVIDYLK